MAPNPKLWVWTVYGPTAAELRRIEEFQPIRSLQEKRGFHKTHIVEVDEYVDLHFLAGELDDPVPGIYCLEHRRQCWALYQDDDGDWIGHPAEPEEVQEVIRGLWRSPPRGETPEPVALALRRAGFGWSELDTGEIGWNRQEGSVNTSIWEATSGYGGWPPRSFEDAIEVWTIDEDTGDEDRTRHESLASFLQGRDKTARLARRLADGG